MSGSWAAQVAAPAAVPPPAVLEVYMPHVSCLIGGAGCAWCTDAAAAAGSTHDSKPTFASMLKRSLQREQQALLPVVPVPVPVLHVVAPVLPVKRKVKLCWA